MKRSNRLVLLIGIFLAIVAFVGIVVLQGGGPKTGDGGKAPTELPTVVATTDLVLGSKVQANQVKVVQMAVDTRDPNALSDTSQAVGQFVRNPVAANAVVTTAAFTSAGGEVLNIDVPAGKRAISVQVDQVSGVGTVIKNGDYVDMVVGFSGDKFPVITVDPTTDSFQVVSGINSTSVKVLLQGMQVLGTLLPPPPADQQNGDQGGGDTGGGSTTLNGQQQIVILAVDAQQSEIIKFAQLDGSISLLLRSPDDFIDPATGQPLPAGPIPDKTTGIILKSLVDTYGVLPPELVETVLPEQGNR